eukprot:gene4958-60903_t
MVLHGAPWCSLRSAGGPRYAMKKAKARKVGNLRFVAELYNRCLVGSGACMAMVRALIEPPHGTPSDDDVEALRAGSGDTSWVSGA